MEIDFVDLWLLMLLLLLLLVVVIIVHIKLLFHIVSFSFFSIRIFHSPHRNMDAIHLYKSNRY